MIKDFLLHEKGDYNESDRDVEDNEAYRQNKCRRGFQQNGSMAVTGPGATA